MICEWGDRELFSVDLRDLQKMDLETVYIMQSNSVGFTIRGFDKQYAGKAVDFINEVVSRMYFCKKGSPHLTPIDKIDFVLFEDPEVLSSDDLAKKLKFTKKIKGQPAIRICLNEFSF